MLLFLWNNDILWVQEEIEIEADSPEKDNEEREIDAPHGPEGEPDAPCGPDEEILASIAKKEEIKWRHYPYIPDSLKFCNSLRDNAARRHDKQTTSFKCTSMYEIQALVGLYLKWHSFPFSKTKISPQNKKRLGLGAAVVFHLRQQILVANHKLFFDNYFTTYNFLEVLKDKQIHAAGKARVSHFAIPPLKSDKEMSNKERVR
ncbi:UNVERIFIED_CONTAM: hypothetical protein FKN15_035899 [Acipenser sinensis]